MPTATSDDLTPELEAELRALEARPPAAPGPDDAARAAAWRDGAERGRFHRGDRRPRKVLKSLRIDADVLDFFESQGPGYQTRMNAALRAAMEAARAAAQKSG
jgi:uncharacterized protein (DUF4415 family)